MLQIDILLWNYYNYNTICLFVEQLRIGSIQFTELSTFLQKNYSPHVVFVKKLRHCIQGQEQLVR